MKRRVAIILALVMAIGVVTGCGKKADTGSSAKSEEQNGKKDTVVVAVDSDDHEGFVPWNSIGLIDDCVWLNVLQPIMKSDKTFDEMKPLVAESYDVSDDGKDVTFHLQKGVAFSDGNDVTAEDVVFSIQQYVDSEYRSKDYTFVEKVEATDDSTVTVYGNSVVTNAPWLLAKIRIVEKSAYEKDPDGYNENPIGCGPYVLKEYKEGKYMLLTVNDNYWKEKPAIKNVKVQVVNDSVLADSILNGDIDFSGLTGEAYEKIKEADKDNITIREDKDIAAGCEYLFFNCQNEVLKDKRVRQAISYAINREKIADLSETMTYLDSYPVPNGMEDYDKAVEGITDYKYDPDKAKELLAEAGYADTLDLGKYIIMYDGIDSEIAQSIQEDLKAVGVNVEIAIEEQSAAFKDINNGDYSIVTSYANFGDQITGLAKVLNTKLIGNYNYANYGNADLDNMTEEALAETEEAKRLDVTRNIVTLLQDEVPVIKLSNDVKFHAYNKELDCTIMYNCFYRFDEWSWK